MWNAAAKCDNTVSQLTIKVSEGSSSCSWCWYKTTSRCLDEPNNETLSKYLFNFSPQTADQGDIKIAALKKLTKRRIPHSKIQLFTIYHKASLSHTPFPPSHPLSLFTLSKCFFLSLSLPQSHFDSHISSFFNSLSLTHIFVSLFLRSPPLSLSLHQHKFTCVLYPCDRLVRDLYMQN